MEWASERASIFRMRMMENIFFIVPLTNNISSSIIIEALNDIKR